MKRRLCESQKLVSVERIAWSNAERSRGSLWVKGNQTLQQSSHVQQKENKKEVKGEKVNKFVYNYKDFCPIITGDWLIILSSLWELGSNQKIF